MEKRYQVFVSSTYTDLQEERLKVMQTLMRLDCIPAGMELFPAIDTEQFEYIKRIIDDSDYYILIIGGRYGSLSEEGISYTEKEYDYAVSKKIPVMAFLHEDISKLTIEKSDIDQEKRDKLIAFRDKVSKNRLIEYWNNANDLSSKVVLSLVSTIKLHPATGWVRANLQSNTESLQEINNLRKKIETLEQEKIELKRTGGVRVANIAELDEKFEIRGNILNSFETEYGEEDYIDGDWAGSLSWREIIAIITPKLIRGESDTYIPHIMGGILYKKLYPDSDKRGKLTNECCDIIKIQLLALGIIDERNITTGLWALSKKGFQVMLNEGSIKTTIEQ